MQIIIVIPTYMRLSIKMAIISSIGLFSINYIILIKMITVRQQLNIHTDYCYVLRMIFRYKVQHLF